MSEFWGVDAPCSGATDVFFPPIVEENPNATFLIVKAYERAKAVCATCPLVFACHARWIDAGRPKTGVWFGTAPKDRIGNLELRTCHRCGEPLNLTKDDERRKLHPACAEANRAERYQRTT